MTHLLLIGAGHAHVEVLRQAARRRLPGLRLTLLTMDAHTAYSGLLPATLRGECTPADATIDCAALAAAAGATLVVAEALSLDLATRHVLARTGEIVKFDLLSLDVGGRPDMPDDAGVPVKPIGGFLRRLATLEAGLRPDARLAVVGHGAGGTELAIALAIRLAGRAGIVLVGPGAPMPTAPAAVQAAAASALRDNHVELVAGRATGFADGALRLAGRAALPCDAAIWTTGVVARRFLARAGLACGPDGCVLVDAALRSLSHDFVFAAGDCATLHDGARPKSGVWAVRAGPVLDANLRAAASGSPLRAWQPQRDALAILGLGHGRAVAWRGRFSLAGRLPDWWKRRIDRRWMARYQEPRQG